jgi:dihydrofolate reductase
MPDTTSARVRVFIACSLDGFIAGDDDDLSWLPPPSDGDDFNYSAFMSEVGCLLMGRATYRVVAAFPGDWPYPVPVLVATTQSLTPKASSVRAVRGDIGALLDEALAVAGGKDVYLDGGNMIRQALDIGRVDELTVSIVPTILGRGAPLFAGAQRQALEVVTVRPYPTLTQLVLRPKAAPAAHK